MLRLTPGDPRGAVQHHWNTGAKENQQLNPGGPSNRQKREDSERRPREAPFFSRDQSNLRLPRESVSWNMGDHQGVKTLICI